MPTPGIPRLEKRGNFSLIYCEQWVLLIIFKYEFYSVKTCLSIFLLLLIFCSCKKSVPHEPPYNYQCDTTYPKSHWPPNIPNTTVTESRQSYFVTNFVDSMEWFGNTGQYSPEDFFRTLDGGNTWTKLTIPNFGDWGITNISASFVDEQNGFGCDFMSRFFIKTHDKGNTWQASALPVTDSFEIYTDQVKFFDANNGIIIARTASGISQYGVRIFSTTDGGANWSFVKTSLNTFDGYQFCFTTLNKGIVLLSMGGAIVTTADGGLTWNTLNTSFTTYSVSCLDSVTYFASSDSAIYKTTNAGLSWTKITIPPYVWSPATLFKTNNFGVVYSTMNNSGNPCGYTSPFYYTTDGGNTWIGGFNFGLLNVYSVSILSNHLIFIDDQGTSQMMRFAIQ